MPLCMVTASGLAAMMAASDRLDVEQAGRHVLPVAEEVVDRDRAEAAGRDG